MTHDGAIIIDTGLENSGFFRSARQFKSAIDSLEHRVERNGQSMAASTAKYIQSLYQASHATETLGRDMHRAEQSTRAAMQELQRAGELANEYRKTSRELSELLDLQEDFVNAGIGEDTAEWNGLQREIERVNGVLEELNSEVNAFRGVSIEAWSDPEMFAMLQYDFAKTEASLASLAKTQQDYNALLGMREDMEANAVTDGSEWQAYGDMLGEIRAGIDSIIAAEAHMTEAVSANAVADRANEAESALNDEYQALLRAGTAISDAQRNLERAAGINVDTEAAQAVEELTDAEASLARETSESMASGGRRVNAFAAIFRSAMDGATNAASRFFSAMHSERMEDVGIAAHGDVNNPSAQVKEAASALDQYMRKWSQMATVSGAVKNAMAAAITPVLHPIQALDRGLATVLSKAGRLVGTLARMAGNGAVSFLKKLASGAKNAAIQLAKLSARAISSGVKKIGSVVAGAAKSLLGMNKAAAKADGMKVGLKNILRYAFGIRSLFALFRRLRTAISEGMGAIAEKDPALKKATESMQKALSALKGSLATAFAPVATAVAPAVTQLINLLTGAINTIGAFMAALTGKTSYQRSIGAIGDTSKSAAKGVKELNRQLAGFDELNILSDKNSGGSGGDSSSSTGYGYETESIDGGITDFVAKLKALWAAADYDGIGRAIAGGINGALAKVRNWISWDNIGPAVAKVIGGFTSAFNGLVDGLDWDGMGGTVAAGVNSLINAFNLLRSGIDFKNIGKKIGEGLNGLVRDIDWNKFGETLGELFTRKLDVIASVLDSFHWETARVNFATGLNGLVQAIDQRVSAINWGGLAFKMTAGLNSFITGTDWDALGTTAGNRVNELLDVIGTTFAVFDWSRAGEALGWGVSRLVGAVDFNKLSDALANGINGAVSAMKALAGQFSWGDIAAQFAGGVNRLVDAVNWNDIGKALGEGIKGALNVLKFYASRFNWGNAATALVDTIKGLASKVTFTDIASTLSEGIKGAITGMTGIVNGFTWDEYGNAGTNFADALNELATADWWTDLARTLSRGVNAAFHVMKNAFKTFKWTEAGGTIADALNDFIGDVNWVDIGDTINTGIQGVLDWGIAFFENFDAKEFGDNLNTALAMVDWGDVAKKVWDLLKLAFKALGDFLTEVIFGTTFEDAVKQVQEADWVGGFADDYFEKVFYPQLGDIGEWIKKNISNTNISAAEFFSFSEWDELGEKTQSDFVELIRRTRGNTYAETYDELLDYGHDITNLIVSGLRSGRTSVAQEGEFLVLTFSDGSKKTIRKEGKTLTDIFTEVGVDMSEGAVAGMDDEMKRSLVKIAEIFGYTEEEAKDALGIHSPSKVFRKIGEFIIKGLINGLETLRSSLKGVWDALPESFKTAINAMLSSIAGVDIDLGVVFSPSDSKSAAYKNRGMLNYLAGIFRKGTTTNVAVDLKKGNYTTIQTFVGTDSPLSAIVNLLKGKGEIGELFGSVLNVLANLTGKKSGSKEPSSLFDTIVEFAGRLARKAAGSKEPKAMFGADKALEYLGMLTSKARDSKEPARLFGSIVDFTGKLTKTADGSKTPESLFGKTLKVYASLQGKDGNSPFRGFSQIYGTLAYAYASLAGKDGGAKFSGFSGIYGTVAYAYSQLLGKAREGGYRDFGGVYGTITSVWSRLLGKDKDGAYKDFGGIYGTIAAVWARLYGKDRDSQSLGDVFGSIASFLGKLTGKDSGSLSLGSIFGTAASFVANLTKNGSNWTQGLAQWLTGNRKGTVDLAVNLVKAVSSGAQKLFQFLGIASGGVISNGGRLTRFASGGAIMDGGRASWWNGVQKYAGGTARAHGTVFVAGEAGPEVVGHVNGRTEILNKSQLAQAIYGAVVSGMGQAVNALGRYLAGCMSACTNAIVATIAVNGGFSDVRFYAPAVSTGAIVPYEVAAQIERSTAELQDTLDANNEDLIQTIISVIGAQTAAIVAALNATNGRNSGNDRIDARQIIDEINRRAMMLGASPLKGL